MTVEWHGFFPAYTFTGLLCEKNDTVSGALSCNEDEMITIRGISIFLTKDAEHNCQESKGVLVYPKYQRLQQLQMEKLIFRNCSFAPNCTLNNESIDDHEDGSSKTYVDYSCEKESKYYFKVMHVKMKPM